MVQERKSLSRQTLFHNKFEVIETTVEINCFPLASSKQQSINSRMSTSTTTTFPLNHEVAFYCINMSTSSVTYYSVLVIHLLLALLTVSISLYAIFGHYLNHNCQLLSQIRIPLVIVSILFGVADINFVIGVMFALKCTFPEGEEERMPFFMYSYLCVSGLITFLCYHLLYGIFVLKLKYSFDGSVLQVSKTKMNWLIAILIVSIIAACGQFIFSLLYVDIIAFLLGGVQALMYIIGNIILAKTFHSKLISLMKFSTTVNNMTINKIKTLHDLTCTTTRVIDSPLYHLFIRLTVVYSCAILSTILISIGILIVVIILQLVDSPPLIGYFFMWCRTLLIIDHIINSLCLLFQIDTAIVLYGKACCLFHSCVIKIYAAQSDMNVTDMNATDMIASKDYSNKIKVNEKRVKTLV